MLLHKIYLEWAVLLILFTLNVRSEQIPDEYNSKGKKSGSEEDILVKIKSQEGKNKKVTDVDDDDDDRSSLAQQVVDGKYALIQKELFSNGVKRPGILSYDVNPEVPKDNINNLGGLKPEEIWLAENHLLVLKGGGFSDDEQTGKVIWPQIDNYIAPKRPVKIPPNPKIPPPFPVQLRDGGPIEVIQGKNNDTTGYLNAPFFLFPLRGNNPKKGNTEERKETGQGNWTEGNGEVPFPFLPPELGAYPPAIAFLPPPGNLTELDEDDPRIYYPPKYDFYYKTYNTSFVPPGPLVPGIVLPPPPNFFSLLKNTTKPQILSNNKQPTGSFKKSSKSRLNNGNGLRNKVAPQVNSYKQKGHSHREHKLISSFRMPSSLSNYEATQKTKGNILNTEWVPIPAPRPFYISEISKLRALTSSKISNPNVKFIRPQNGWDLDNNTSGDVSINSQVDSVINSYVSSGDGNIQDDSIYYTTERIKTNIHSPTAAPNPYYDNEEPAHSFVEDEKARYTLTKYNPPFSGGSFINPLSHQTVPQYIQQYLYSKPFIEFNSVVPPRGISDVSAKNLPVNGRVILPKLKYEDLNKPVKGNSKPITYIYYEQEPKYQADGSNSYEAPKTSAGSPYQQDENHQFSTTESTNYQIYTPSTRYSASGHSSTTEKPPVFEYSFSAPGYGTVEAPKISTYLPTTPKPDFYETLIKPNKQPKFSYLEYEPASHQTAAQGSYSTLSTLPGVKPKFEKGESYQTENPYLTYNTQDVGVLDDITKKYFSLFGQKLHQDSSRGETSTIAPVKSKTLFEKLQYRDYETDSPVTSITPNPHIRLPEAFQTQNENRYYENTQNLGVSKFRTPQNLQHFRVPESNAPQYPSDFTVSRYRVPQNLNVPRYRPSLNPQDSSAAGYNAPQKPNTGQIDNYSFFLSSGNGGFHNYKYYNGGIVRPNYDLSSDIAVNYKNPKPVINPDAEFIDPALIGNSYRLPGRVYYVPSRQHYNPR